LNFFIFIFFYFLNYRNLTDITRLESFVHLRFIDLSNNRLRTINSLNRLKFLLTIKLDSNELSSFDLPPFTYLQTLSLSNNRLRSVVGIEQPRLEILNLNRMFIFCDIKFYFIFFL
jgi:hypothetical protein